MIVRAGRTVPQPSEVAELKNHNPVPNLACAVGLGASYLLMEPDDMAD